jgi:hypothetical protein
VQGNKNINKTRNIMKSTTYRHKNIPASEKKKIGYKILNSGDIPHYEIDNTDSTTPPTTRARDFVQKQGINSSVIISVIGKKKIQKFFWSRSGLYSLEYVAANYAGFSELAAATRNFNEAQRETQKRHCKKMQVAQ